MSDEEDTDDAQVALAVFDGTTPDLDPELTRRHLDLIEELESLRAIRAAFDALPLPPHAVRRPPPAVRRPPPYPTWGPFQLSEEIGRGAFGIVCRAFDPATARDVAVKLYPGRDLPAEPRFLGRVRHPNVVTIFGAAVHDSRPG